MELGPEHPPPPFLLSFPFFSVSHVAWTRALQFPIFFSSAFLFFSHFSFPGQPYIRTFTMHYSIIFTERGRSQRIMIFIRNHAVGIAFRHAPQSQGQGSILIPNCRQHPTYLSLFLSLHS